ncbi:hypothetical protein Q7P35_000715 [Cladosporium inversicolor]
MVVFKKPSKAVPASSSQTTKSFQKPKSESNTTTVLRQHTPTSKPLPALMRYSDIAANRDAKDNGNHIEKLMYIPELCDETNIENSFRLQAKLFLAPDLTMKKFAVSATGTLLSGAKSEQPIAAAANTEDGEGGEIALFVLHPQLEPAYLSHRYKRMGMAKYAEVCVQTRGDQNDAKVNFRYLQNILALPETSSLHRMLLCQPPVKEVSAMYRAINSHRSTWTFHVTARNEAGVTIGDVITALRNAPGLMLHWEAKRSFCDMSFKGGFLVDSLARSVAERSAGLSSEDDPTRLVDRGEPWVLGRFSFITRM